LVAGGFEVGNEALNLPLRRGLSEGGRELE
jgi:hypothetical protein